MLSGGEKVRLALCKIFKTKPNFLILDEPTNHMDIIGKESLESMLKEFPGSVLFVSHDRYFVNQIADALLVFEEGKVSYLPYKYEEYAARKNGTYAASVDQGIYKAKQAALEAEKKAAEKTKAGAELPAQKGKESYTFGKERSRLEKKVQKLEEQIRTLETLIEEKKAELLLPENASNYAKLEEISAEIEEREMELLAVMEEWENTDHQLQEYL